MVKSLLLHSSRYLSASLISAGAAFLMTKFYTNNFSPAEFGVMIVYLMMFEYISMLGTLSTEGSVARKIFDHQGKELNEYLNTILWFYIILCVIIFSVGLILSDYISNWVAEDTKYIYYLVIISGCATVFVKFFNNICVNLQQSKRVSLALVFNTLSSHPLSIFYVLFVSHNVAGRFIGALCGSIFQLYMLLGYSKNIIDFKFRREINIVMLKETLYLALPTISSTILIMLLSYADRLFLKEFSGDTSVGLYGLALIIGKLITIVFEATSKAIFPAVMVKLTENYTLGMKKIESLTVKYYALIFITVVIVISISPFITMLISNENYASTNEVIPFVVIGIAMGGMYKFPSVVLSYHKIVWFYLPVTVFSFLTSAALNYILIPSYGIVGAGLSSCIGYFIYSVLVQVFAWKYFSLRYKLITFLVYLFSFFWIIMIAYENYHI